MYACICHAVAEDRILDAVDAGAHTVEAIGTATLAGTGCGTCHDHLEELIESRCDVCPLLRLVVA